MLKINVTTLEAKIKSLVEDGKKKGEGLKYLESQLKQYGNIEFSEEEYKKLNNEKSTLVSKTSELRVLITNLRDTNVKLEKAEYCPTCKRKLDNVDNSAVIEENKKKIESYTKEGIESKKRLEEVEKEIALIEEKRKQSQEKSKLELKIATLKSDIASMRLDYKEQSQLLSDVNKSKDAITKNGEIDAQINVIDTNIKTEDRIKNTSVSTISSDEKEISRITEAISQKNSFIVKIEEERKVEKYWKLYLQMIGKDGISKMVLRNTLPIINAELNRLLNGVSDFNVEITMNDKNDIDFLLIRDGIKTRLSAASGLERTQASLALRVVLGRLSKLSKPPFILLDEILGTVAKENYDDMKKLYDKIAEYYDFVLNVCHVDLDWYTDIITIVKENNISSIKSNY